MNNKLIFDHKIKSPKLKTRNAIKILDLYDYPSEIIREAKEIEATFFLVNSIIFIAIFIQYIKVQKLIFILFFFLLKFIILCQ